MSDKLAPDRLMVAILAAGSANRFGGGKLDRELAGKKLGRHVLDAALTLDSAKPVIVVGEPAPHFARAAAEAGMADLLVNRHAEQGLATSVALAAHHAAKIGTDSLLLLLADMPLVAPATLAALTAKPGHLSAVRHADGRAGIPACFPAGWFEALQALEGDKGAAAILRQAQELRLVPISARELLDIDTQADLDTLEGELRG